ncbi:MAG: hypothetical protein GEU28_09820 [Dehalococcoidia bacterium]|nr:hypothetical protein [Dehalococcoidia bacterium]
MVAAGVAGSAFLTVFLLIFAVLTRRTAGGATQARLSALSAGYGSYEAPVWLQPDLLRANRMSRIPVLEMLLERREFAKRAELELERAAVPLRVAEYVLLRIASAFVLFMFGNLLFGGIIFAIPAAAVGYLLPRIWLSRKRSARISALNSQLPDTVQLISSSLKGGFALLQAFEAAADRVPQPMSSEINHMIKDIGLGSNIEEAIQAWCDRIPGPDLEILVNAILVQRTVGGNLGEILDNVGQTMRERIKLQGEIRALTAQQRLSGFVIGALPIALFVGLFFLNRDYISVFWEEPIGNALLAVALVMEVISFFVIKKILSIDI